MTGVEDDKNKLLGIFTDGDLRRTFDKNIDVRNTTIAEVMTTECKTIKPHLLAAEALHLMESHKITALLVVDDQHTLLGVIHMHDLLEKGMS